MAIEISIESYLFTCSQCATRWTESYQVSQAIDDSGTIRSLYRSHGVSCEAPVLGNVACPNCRGTRSRRDPLYGMPPDVDLAQAVAAPAVPGPRPSHEGAAGPARPTTAGGTWRRFKFSAVLSLEAAGRSRRQYPSGVPGLMLRAPSSRRPTQERYFPAVVYTDEDRPLRPGDHAVPVVISVPDDDAPGYFETGQHFTVWDGTDIGHGTVAQRLSFLLW